MSDRIPERRRIIDRAALYARLEALCAEESPQAARPAVLAELRRALRQGRDEVRRRFDEGWSGEKVGGEEASRMLAFLMDQLIRVIYDFASRKAYPAANPTAAERLCLAAVGGYGRGEMAPQSDIDLLFLLPYRETPRLEQLIEYVLYMLWDLKLKVGQATRSVDQCIRLAGEDVTIKTAMLESRYLWGEKALFDELSARFDELIEKDTRTKFVEQKLAEREARHQRMGDSRYVLEPNIKDGKGGLRDLHTLYWIAKYLYRVRDVSDLVGQGVFTAAEYRRFARAHRFLWDLRFRLHYLTGRAEDRLTFDAQPEMARLLGYREGGRTPAVERFMKHYYLVAKEVGNLTRIFCSALEAEHRRKPRFSFPRVTLFGRLPEGFVVESGRLAAADPNAFRDDPVNILRLFHIAQDREIDVHPNALRSVTRNLRAVDDIRDDPAANRLFLEMLTSQKAPEITLRRLNEAGVFGRFIPEFGRVVAQMQHDMYHVFTVDEHSIHAIGILHGIEQGTYAEEMPIASEVIHKVKSRAALYAAVLLHDIGKGRGGDHSEIGAAIATELCPRLGLSDEETETVEWLVRYHLAMSNTAFRRDVNDPKTIADFTELVQSVERLRLLVVLTAADIRAVGPNVWNGWKAALLRELYNAAEDALAAGMRAEGREKRIAAAQNAVRALLTDFSEQELESYFDNGYPPYWLTFDADTHAFHARMMRGARRNDAALTIEKRIDSFRDVTEITIYTPDHPGLFSRIAGAMAVSGASVVDAKIFTMADGWALDTFWIQDAEEGAFDRPDKLTRLYARIEDTLSGRLRPVSELAKQPSIPSRTRVFKVAPRVLIDNDASRAFTVIEVNGRDRPGLLYDLTRALSGLGLQIGSAHITTYGESAVDVFYVKDVFGLQVTHEAKLAQIRQAMMRALSPKAEEKPAAGAHEAAE